MQQRKPRKASPTLFHQMHLYLAPVFRAGPTRNKIRGFAARNEGGRAIR